ncbi:MAG: preprotein translocase subunit YajC, partial [Acidimicrobiales bacterium]
VRPQQQRARRQRELVASLAVGDEVVTAGGIVGRIVSLDDEEARLEVSPGVVLRFVRFAVNSLVDAPADAAGPGEGLPEAEEE